MSGLKDTRNPERITYSFELLMISALCAIMAGEDSFTGIADYLEVNREIFSKYFDLPKYLPTHDTYNRLFDSLEANEFEEWFKNYTQEIAEYCCSLEQEAPPYTHLAIDGKTSRNSHLNSARNLHVVSVWSTRHKLVLCQQKVDEKSNEVKTVPVLLSLLDLEKTVITLDGLHCQRETCQPSSTACC